MRLDTHFRRHWSHTTRHFLVDVFLWIGAFLLATWIRFHYDAAAAASSTAAITLNLGVSGLLVASLHYVSGVYGIHGVRPQRRVQLAALAGALLLGFVTLLILGSLDFSARIGRGILGIGWPLACGLILVHHLYLERRNAEAGETAGILVTGPEDEIGALLVKQACGSQVDLKGCFAPASYPLHSDLERLGTLNQLAEQVERLDLRRIYFSRSALEDRSVADHVRRLRYSGVPMTSIAETCEEYCQAIPLVLIDPEWLIDACGQPEHAYVAKMKRAFDVAAALGVGLGAFPLLLVGMLLVRLSSPGPVFFSQVRVGRFHRPFRIHKLRTMRTDAEDSGARWSGSGDSRVTLAGHWLRKFRIDEIPQLWNVLRGEMSFIGPRPEVPEFVDRLAEEIPYYQERHLVRPGLTGWAQVCYPYGASVEDARRKLEFDLYYLKHMGLLMDLFVFLDTIKVVFRGGASLRRGERLARFDAAFAEARRSIYGASQPDLTGWPPPAKGAGPGKVETQLTVTPSTRHP